MSHLLGLGGAGTAVQGDCPFLAVSFAAGLLSSGNT